MRVFLVILACLLAWVYADPPPFVCCGVDVGGDVNGGQRTDHFWAIITPDDSTIECHKNIVPNIADRSVDIHGRAWEINACHFPNNPFGSGVCGSGVNNNDGWCDEDDGQDDDCGDLICPRDDDDDGLGTNAPLTRISDAVAPGCGSSETITRTWTSTTVCPGGGRLTDTQIITISDTTLPFVAILEDFTLECAAFDPSTADYLFGFASVFDMCNSNPTVTRVITQGTTTNCDATFAITYSADDGCFTTPGLVHTVRVEDTRAPIIEGSSFYSQDCTSIPTDIDTMPTATDFCYLAGAAPTVTTVSELLIPGDCQGNFIIERTYMATDTCGNSATAKVYGYVTDITPPTLNPDVPSNVATVNCITDVPSSFPSDTYTATDDCSNEDLKVVVDVFNSNSIDDLYETKVSQRVVATDGCGNTVTRLYERYVQYEDVDSVLSVTGPASVAKGSNFQLMITTEGDTCANSIIVIDAGALTLQPDPIFSQSGNGLIYGQTTLPVSTTITLSVPAVYLPSFIRITASIAEDRNLGHAGLDSIVIQIT